MADIYDSLFHDNREEVDNLLTQKDQLVEDLTKVLYRSWRSFHLSKEDEIYTWNEFIEMPPFVVGPKLAGYVRIKNGGAFVISFSDQDIKIGHRILRRIYNIEISPEQENTYLNLSEIRGMIIASAVQKHLASLEPPVKQSRKESFLLLAKVRLLYEFGFFETLKAKGMTENKDIAELLSILIGGDKDNLRRMAANTKERNSDTKSSCDPFNTKTEKEVFNLLNTLYPKLYPKVK